MKLAFKSVLKLSVLTALLTALLSGGVLAYKIAYADNISNILKPTLIKTKTETNTPTIEAVDKSTKTSSILSKVLTRESIKPCSVGRIGQVTTPSIAVSNPGLHINQLDNTNYVIYGNDVTQIRNQMLTCSPIVEDGIHFAGSTSYSINWTSSFITNAEGKCIVDKVSVGINIAQTYPAWDKSSNASNATLSKWTQFINTLATHENGHADISRNGASKLYSDLTSFGVFDCETIGNQLEALATHDIQAISQANDAYDSATNHGVTQGAVL